MGLAIVAFAVNLLSQNGEARSQPSTVAIDPSLLKPHMVDLGGGRSSNFHCVGTGSPTLVFEQGGNALISDWALLQRKVSALTRTCFYDRAGFGYSDPPKQPITAISVTDDLHTLLRRAGVHGPVVLVGHSIGGFYATMYADRFLGEVAGLVLVDPAVVGQQISPTTDHEQANIRRGEGYLVACAALARAGKLTAANLEANRCYPVPQGSSPDEARYILHAVTRPYWYESEESQSVNYFPADDGLSVSWRQEKEAARSFGDIPVVVLSAGIYESDDWRTEAQTRELTRLWRTGHQALAARSTRGRFLIVPEAHHFIWKDKPEAVFEAIDEVVNRIREEIPAARH